MATWKSENSMLTQVGVEILNKIKLGVGSITVTRVVAGSGRVSASQLFRQTAVSGTTKPMIITSKEIKETGSDISIYITNENFTESFDFNQIGVYVTHPEYDGEQLYHISQCEEEGFDVIPALDETPVTFEYSLFLEHGNSSSINLTVDPQGMVSNEKFNGLAASTVAPNLVDNWYFLNPVTLGALANSPISRWSCPAGTSEITDEGLVIRKADSSWGYGFLRTVITDKTYLLGKQATVSVLTTEGLYSKTGIITSDVNTTLYTFFGDNYSHFRVYYTSEGLLGELISTGDDEPAILAVKLELGTMQTLAHRDLTGNWILNEIPNFAEVFSKCSQYDPVTGEYYGPNLFNAHIILKGYANGHGAMFKNHSATADYGTEISDVDKNGNSASLALMSSEDPKNGATLVLKYNGSTYKLYGEHNKHLISSVIPATIE